MVVALAGHRFLPFRLVFGAEGTVATDSNTTCPTFQALETWVGGRHRHRGYVFLKCIPVPPSYGLGHHTDTRASEFARQPAGSFPCVRATAKYSGSTQPRGVATHMAGGQVALKRSTLRQKSGLRLRLRTLLGLHTCVRYKHFSDFSGSCRCRGKEAHLSWDG